jgi:hypothetical protein
MHGGECVIVTGSQRLLRQYKSLLKTVSHDASLRPHHETRYAGKGAWSQIPDEELSNSDGMAAEFKDSGAIEDANGTTKTWRR